MTLVAAGVAAAEVANRVGKRELDFDFELSFIIAYYYDFGRSDQMLKRQSVKKFVWYCFKKETDNSRLKLINASASGDSVRF